jgi:hypothetical protein
MSDDKKDPEQASEPSQTELPEPEVWSAEIIDQPDTEELRSTDAEDAEIAEETTAAANDPEAPEDTAPAEDALSVDEQATEDITDTEMSNGDAPDESGPVEDVDDDGTPDADHWSETYSGVTGDDDSAETKEVTEPKEKGWHDTSAGAVYAAADDLPPEPEPEPEAETEAQSTETASEPLTEEYEEQAEQRSFAATALTYLVILILGGALFVWGGPRVAPLLPSGLAPVASWLTPGTPAEIESLQAELSEREAALDARLQALESAPGLDVATDAMEARAAELADEIVALSDQMTATDSGAIEARLATLETRVAGIEAEVNALSGALTGLATSTESVTAEAVEGFNAQIAGLQAELADLAGRQGALLQRLDEVEATADRRIAEAEERVAAAEAEAARDVTSATAAAEVNALAAALESGAPFSAALAPMQAVMDVPDALVSAAPSGIATQAELEEQFPDLAHTAIRADILAQAGDSAFSRAAAEVRARTAGRFVVETAGESVDAVLSRVEARLKEGALAAALNEAEALPDAARTPLSAWLTDLQTRADALAAFADVSAQFTAN